MARFADTIGKRDDQVRALLANANKIATVLGDRSGQVNALLVNAQILLHALNQRGEAIGLLLERVSKVSHQLQATIDENPNINHVLQQLKTIGDILVARKADLADTLVSAGKFIASLSEAIASGPYFKVMVENLLPPQLMQPFIDAAFKKRGLDPQDFWRSAGLPEAKWPDPNGTRFANGAPPPAPTLNEGTPEHPGPAVPPGIAMLVHPGCGCGPDACRPTALCPPAHRAIRWQLRTAGRQCLGTQPGRGADRPGCPGCDLPRSACTGCAGYPGALAGRSGGCAHGRQRRHGLRSAAAGDQRPACSSGAGA